MHSKGDPETCISGNLKFGNNEDVIAEVDMTVDREKRTLHFFVCGKLQPISFVGLPSRIKFCV